MFDDNVTIKILLAFVAAAATALRLVLADGRMRRSQPSLSFAADTWATEKFGIWWAGRGVMVLAIFAAGIGFAFLGTGSSAGSLILSGFSVVATALEFTRSKM
ncbi:MULTISPECIES: hypothetical protein [unclassified Bradyrhizobium]|uniref:hypothetical protein n=1 Tax=unclassified Bradyrhizobium TaxID=2631580 RepID=UPI0024E093B6|nr:MULTISPECIES: hypothetical protein [unclassified Bradyrhizobium]